VVMLRSKKTKSVMKDYWLRLEIIRLEFVVTAIASTSLVHIAVTSTLSVVKIVRSKLLERFAEQKI